MAAYYRPPRARRSWHSWLAIAAASLLTPSAILAAGKVAFSWLDARYVHADAYTLRTHDDSLEHVYDDLRAYAVRQAVDSIERAHQRHPDRVLQAGRPREEPRP